MLLYFFCLTYVGVKNDVVYETSQALMEKLAVEAFQVAMVFHIFSFFYNVLE